jgi:hypothetical protein
MMAQAAGAGEQGTRVDQGSDGALHCNLMASYSSHVPQPCPTAF